MRRRWECREGEVAEGHLLPSKAVLCCATWPHMATVAEQAARASHHEWLTHHMLLWPAVPDWCGG